MRTLKDLLKRLLCWALLLALLVLAAAGTVLGVQGWKLYRATQPELPAAQLYETLSAHPGFTTCDAIPQTYIDAVIAVEDSRFELHHGVDPVAIVRALWTDLRTRSLAEGGSTLTQQLAKNIYFTQEKRFARKAAELFAALDIEKHCSKQQIFEMYVNTIYFGSGCYGIAEAAEGYFGKTPAELTSAECVLLAGLPNAPSASRPIPARSWRSSARRWCWTGWSPAKSSQRPRPESCRMRSPRCRCWQEPDKQQEDDPPES